MWYWCLCYWSTAHSQDILQLYYQSQFENKYLFIIFAAAKAFVAFSQIRCIYPESRTVHTTQARVLLCLSAESSAESSPIFTVINEGSPLVSSHQWCPWPWVSPPCSCGAFWLEEACRLPLQAPPTSQGKLLCMGYAPLGCTAYQTINING